MIPSPSPMSRSTTARPTSEIQMRNKGLSIEIQTVAEIMLLRPFRSLHPSATRKTAVSVFLSALTYTGLLSIFAKFKAMGALGCRERVAAIRLSKLTRARIHISAGIFG